MHLRLIRTHRIPRTQSGLTAESQEQIYSPTSSHALLPTSRRRQRRRQVHQSRCILHHASSSILREESRTTSPSCIGPSRSLVNTTLCGSQQGLQALSCIYHMHTSFNYEQPSGRDAICGSHHERCAVARRDYSAPAAGLPESPATLRRMHLSALSRRPVYAGQYGLVANRRAAC